jgi:isoleucyl-tRNA synthetase
MVELVTRDAAEMSALRGMQEIIGEELNVKEVIFGDNEADLVEYEAKANFRVLGKELGANMKAAAAQIAALQRADIEKILSGGEVEITVGGGVVKLNAAKLDIKRIEKSGLKVINEGSLTVALDTEITEDLRNEGDVRDLVRGVQKIRKESGINVSDRITLYLHGSAKLEAAYKQFASYIAGETLATKIIWGAADNAIELPASADKWLVKVEKE